MKFKNIVYCATVFVFGVTASCAAAKKQKNTNFKLLEAFTQQEMQGKPSPPPPTGEHIVIIWTSNTEPETFYWRGQSGFMMCMIQKAHKIDKKDAKKFPPGMDYILEQPGASILKKGDTIEITPVARGKVRIPDEIPQNVTNTLFYKTTGSGWLLFPVKSFTKKRAIAMQ